jgi:hypothetical protein
MKSLPGNQTKAKTERKRHVTENRARTKDAPGTLKQATNPYQGVEVRVLNEHAQLGLHGEQVCTERETELKKNQPSRDGQQRVA